MLFGIALWGERNGGSLQRAWPAIYTLSLAVHCTAWTYYGTAAQAAQWGFPVPPTYIGITVLFVFGIGFLRRLGRIAQENNSATIADLVTSRFGKDRRLGIAITAVALLGIVPYIALQLKAVAQSYKVLTGSDIQAHSTGLDASLWIALIMAAFTMLFGTRRVAATEHNRGIVLALGFESLLKLGALLAVGIFAVWGANAGLPDLLDRAARLPSGKVDAGFYTLIGLGAVAAFTLPHQFHVGIVELRKQSDLATARWLFPLYLLLIALPALPIAWAGQLRFDPAMPMDVYALALPLSGGQHGLALVTYLGGMSAATGMMILSALTLSIMMANHWVGSRVVRDATRSDAGSDLRPRVLAHRRVGILAVFIMAWLYSRAMSGVGALGDFGVLSFTALAQLAPAVVLAVYRPRLPSVAILAGIVAGSIAWIWLMLLPMAIQAGAMPSLESGIPWRWLVPDVWFGFKSFDGVAGGMLVSLFVNAMAIFAVGRLVRTEPDRLHAGISAKAMKGVAQRFLHPKQIQRLFGNGRPGAVLNDATVAAIERELVAVVGAGMARLLIEAVRDGESAPLDTVTKLVGEATQALRFNQRVLEAAMENMSQGISVVDAQLRLVAWNRRYATMFGFPDELLQVGRPIADLTRWALERMPSGAASDPALKRRMRHMRAGTQHLSERRFPDGSIVEIRGNPMPDGGFVATFTDVTAFRRAEAALIQANETLEQRVVERTTLLEAAKHEAEHANDAKSRFLAAIGHDLLQPLHAAHLFTDALGQQIDDAGHRASAAQHTIVQIRGALDSTTDLLTGLLDMSRLEAGGLVPEPREFPIAEVLEPLASEFRALAAEHGLAFRYLPTQAWTHSDPQLLRRVLQNFLANAVRYAGSGGVLLGVRRCGDRVRIEVHDTGPGIASDQQTAIFEEFRRGEDAAGQGLGLGLAIAERIAHLIEAPLSLRSRIGVGTVFAVDVPQLSQRAVPVVPPSAKPNLSGLQVLVVDNEPTALHALKALLEGWGCQVAAAMDGERAQALINVMPADLWLFDYHLDANDTGVALSDRLAQHHRARPAVILSADRSEGVRRAVHEAGLPLLMKPLKPLALKSVLDRVLAARMVP